MYFNLFVMHLVTTFLFQVLGMKIKEWTFTFENNNVFQFIRFVRFFFLKVTSVALTNELNF